jgi:quercetin dioxygenase-like cupin family protein
MIDVHRNDPRGQTGMTLRTPAIRTMAAVMAACLIAIAPSSAQQIGLKRAVLLQRDLPIPGYEVIVVKATIAVGGREGRHTHAGTLVAYVLEGELTLEVDGQPTRVIKTGESALIEPGRVHEGINKGSVPMIALATFIAEKGKPLTTPVVL